MNFVTFVKQDLWGLTHYLLGINFFIVFTFALLMVLLLMAEAIVRLDFPLTRCCADIFFMIILPFLVTLTILFLADLLVFSFMWFLMLLLSQNYHTESR